MVKRVCVIGGGTSGICAVKCCVEEGLEPTCYESRKDIGGMWFYDKNEKLNRCSSYASLITNVSKEATCFSDFPFPKESAPYINRYQFQEYLKRYIEHNNLEKYIHLGIEVVSVVENDDASKKGWQITTRNVESQDCKTEEYDCVMVCTGYLARPLMPNYEGLNENTFKGRIMHSCEYESSEEFEGKNVLIIGFGNSGADISVDISRKASKTFLSSRNGAWVLPHVYKNGLPPEMILTSRFKTRLRQIVPTWVANWMARKLINAGFDHKALGIESRYEPMNPNCSYFLNDELPSRIVCGAVQMRPEVTKFTSNAVHFSNGMREKVDVVVCAIGYTASYPFISDSILPDELADMKLFEWMIPFNISDPSSFAVIGLTPSAGGALIPKVECQSRYFCQVMAGVSNLPSVESMRAAHEKDRINYTSHGRPFIFKTQIGFAYQDRMAKMAGFYPSFWSLLFRDPRLAFAVHFGPFMPYHYRLFGRFPWKQARSRTLDAIANTLYSISRNRPHYE